MGGFKQKRQSTYLSLLLSHISLYHSIRVGTPKATLLSGISPKTTDPAPMWTGLPISMEVSYIIFFL